MNKWRRYRTIESANRDFGPTRDRAYWIAFDALAIPRGDLYAVIRGDKWIERLKTSDAK